MFWGELVEVLKDFNPKPSEIVQPFKFNSEDGKIRVIIPSVVDHKDLARSYVWWPKLDQFVERLVKTCCMFIGMFRL